MANNDFNERLRVLSEQFDSALKDESHGGRYNGVQKISDEPINKDGVDYYLTSRTRDGRESIGYEKVTPEIDEHFAELAKIKTAQDKIAEEIKAFYDEKAKSNAIDKSFAEGGKVLKTADLDLGEQKVEDTKEPNFDERFRVLGEQLDRALKDESHGGRFNGVEKIDDKPFNKDGVDCYMVSFNRDGGTSIGTLKVSPELDEHFAELAEAKTANAKLSEEYKAFVDKKFEMSKTKDSNLSTQRVEDTINVSRNSSTNINVNRPSGSAKKIEDNMTVSRSQNIINTGYSSGDYKADYDKSGNGSHKTLQSPADSSRKSLFDGMDIKGVSGSYKRMTNTTSVDADSPFSKNEQELASKKTEVREKTQNLYEDFKELLPSQTAINKATGDFCAKLKQHYEEANPDYTVNFGKKTSVQTGVVDYYSEFRPKNLPEGKTSGDVLKISTANGITLNDKPIAMCLRDASSEAAIKGINKHLDAAKAYVPDATEAVKERYAQMKAAIDKAKNNGDFGDDGNKGPNGPKGPGE